jgi:hypothetical protein
MRATINFEVDVDQVENTMAVLMAMESDTLRAIADMIDVNPGPRTMVLEEVTQAIHLLSSTTAQLEQYRQMLVSFEKAKFETIPPQPVEDASLMTNLAEVRASVDQMKQFDAFLQRAAEEEVEDESQEG